MLDPYFSFGVPSLLLILYVAFALFQRSAHIPYLGFGLFIIAGFLTGFSLQVIQLAWSEVARSSIEQLQDTYHYSPYLLLIPLVLGLLLISIHLYQGYLKVKTVHLRSK